MFKIMNTLETKIQNDLMNAMKNHQEDSISALRSLKTAIQNEKTNGVYHELEDADIVKLVQKQIKQRQESIEIFEQAGRHELADKEQSEMFVLMNYAPKMMTEDEIKSYVDIIIGEVGAASMKDMGKVMQLFNSRYSGRADGKVLSGIVRAKLNV